MNKQNEETKSTEFVGKFKQFIATMCLGAISVGSSAAWTSPVLPQLMNQNSTTTFHLTTEEGSWIASMLAIGVLISAIPSGYLADRLGPKRCIIGLALPVIAFTVIVISANDVYTLCVARVLSGIATGGVCAVAPMYISEIADVSLRGTLSFFFELLIYLGIVATAILGAFLEYITLTLISGSLALLLAIIFFFMPESPTYLMKTDQKERAETALRFYRSKDYDVIGALEEISSALSVRSQHKINICEVMKTKAVIRGLVACVGLTIFQQLSGIDGVLFYNVYLFQSTGVGLDAYTSSIIVGMVQLVSCGAVIGISEKANRKTFLYISCGGTCVCLALFGLFFTFKEYGIDFVGIGVIPLTSMIFYNIFFAVGLGPIPWIINGELFSSEIKGLANGITIESNWVFLFVITKTLPTLMNDWGPHYTFYTYSVCMAACLVFVKFCVPETKGKTLEQIQDELKA